MNNLPRTSDAATLSADLLQRSVRDYLFPLAKACGGIPVQFVRAQEAKAGHYTNMTRDGLVAALLACHGPAKVAEQMALMNAAPVAQVAAPAVGANEATTLAEIIRRIAGGAVQSVDAEQVKAIANAVTDEKMASMMGQVVAAAADAARAAAVTVVRVERDDAPPIECGIQHVRFPLLLKMLGARLPNGRRVNVWLHGPAGTGKTTAARSASKALGLNFYFSGAIETPYALMGYTDAHGRLVRTPFRDAWEKGGVFLMDEADASHPQALAALNAAIDGGVAAFSDAMVERHPDFVLVAGANTVGRGGSTKYAGRVRQDEAFLSRYSMLEWPHDDALETAMVATDDDGRQWLAVVRKFRKAAEDAKIEGASTTARASLDGAALLRAGLPKEIVAEATIRKGMPNDSWARLVSAAGGF